MVLVTEHVLLVGTAGCTIGHRVAGLRVETLDGRPPGPVRALVRSLLLCLVVPPLIWDRDQRGLHDRAAGTSSSAGADAGAGSGAGGTSARRSGAAAR